MKKLKELLVNNILFVKSYIIILLKCITIFNPLLFSYFAIFFVYFLIKFNFSNKKKDTQEKLFNYTLY